MTKEVGLTIKMSPQMPEGVMMSGNLASYTNQRLQERFLLLLVIIYLLFLFFNNIIVSMKLMIILAVVLWLAKTFISRFNYNVGCPPFSYDRQSNAHLVSSLVSTVQNHIGFQGGRDVIQLLSLKEI